MDKIFEVVGFNATEEDYQTSEWNTEKEAKKEAIRLESLGYDVEIQDIQA